MARNALAVTPGDPAGIGAEVVWKAIQKNHLRWRGTPLLCIGARIPFEKLNARIISADPADLTPPRESLPFVWLLEAPVSANPALLLDGYQTGWAIETATDLVRSGECAALVTGPLHKGRLNQGGYPFSGHTDFIASLCSKNGRPAEVTMMLANDTLRVSLVTTHCSLADVSKKITRESVARTIDQTIHALRTQWKIEKPFISICSLNPHAGEGGLFGHEEGEIITPTIVGLRKKWGSRARISDALPADTLFANHVAARRRDRADAVVAMYHDQGLTPVKLVDFPHTVNVTLGLPIIRTSVDHGTAFDIAWKNRADSRSFQSATDLAIKLISRRRRK